MTKGVDFLVFVFCPSSGTVRIVDETKEKEE